MTLFFYVCKLVIKMAKKEISEKQKAFCREYIKLNNATQAYINIYGTKNKQVAANEGSELLKNDKIKGYIDKLNKPLEAKAISEREKKRAILWEWITSPNTKEETKARAMDILNKMDWEYKTIVENNSPDLSGLTIDEIKDMLK